MSHMRSLLLSLLATAVTPAAVLSADIWTEDFTGQEGKGMYGYKNPSPVMETNMTDIIRWTVAGAGGLDGDGDAADPNWWMVTNGVFEGQDVGTSIGYWRSESIDVSTNGAVEVRMDFLKVGDGCNSDSEYFEVRYILDTGHAGTLLSISSNIQDSLDGTTWTSAAIDSSSATGIVIEGRIKINNTGDGWAFDNVALQTALPNQPPVLSDIGTKATSSGSALVFDVIASDPVDGDAITLTASNLPPGALFAPTSAVARVTNTFTWSSVNPIGVYTTTFYAVDGDGFDSEAVEITVAGVSGEDSRIWINEIHYDNTGGDTNEGFEVAGPAGWDLSDYTVYLYNGNGGGVYRTTALSGTIDDEGDGYGAVWFGGPQNYMQNDGPDGLAVVRMDAGETNLLQFISYEGAFVGVGGPADGVGSTDIVVKEHDPAPPVGESLQLIGKGELYADFTWIGPTNHSRGFLNAGQVLRAGSTILIVR